MADQGAPASPGFGSAADLMIEALDKASTELEKTVNSCIEELNNANTTLEKNLQAQIQKVIDQSKNFLASNSEDLTTHKEELIDRLSEFERTEMETLVSSAQELRQLVAARGQQAGMSISKLVEEQIDELHSLIQNPESRFTNFNERGTQDLQNIVGQAKLGIESGETALEQALSSSATELDMRVADVITDMKKSIEVALEKYNRQMEEKIASVINQLTEVVASSITELQQKANQGTEKIKDCGEQSKKRLADHLENWTKDSADVGEDFRKSIDKNCQTAENTHADKLERKVEEVRSEINHIADEAGTRLTASHKLFFSSLKRLEKKYNDKLERLLHKFESALAEETKIGTGSVSMQTAHELRDILHARLQARSQEILKAFNRQVELLESEYTRSSAGSNERIEHIRAASIESLDKQVRDAKNQLDRISRNFSDELSELRLQLPQIEEAGRAAALAVMAYRSAMLSFERD